jgi:hypothetical protein
MWPVNIRKLFTAEGAEDAKDEENSELLISFATFESVAVNFFWLVANC